MTWVDETNKPTVLVPVGVYLPGHEGGGPIRSISNLIERLDDEFQFRVVTSIDNLREAGKAERYQAGTWKAVGPCKVRYLTAAERLLPRLAAIIGRIDADAIYLNAFFPTPFTLPVLLMNRLGLLRDTAVVLAPRGQFYDGAFRQKRWKKTPFLAFAKAIGLYDGIVWQATTQEEREQIEVEFGGDADVQLAPNLGTLPYSTIEEKQTWGETESGRLRAAFVSRVSPKKNLDGALRLLREVEGEVEYNIYGPLWSEEYWRECEEIIASLPDRIEVNYHGAIPHEEVFEVFADHDLFLFPTHGENFGHVIFEALVSGCPVLVSQQTPWRGLEDEGVGWDRSLEDKHGLVEAIQYCIDADEEEYRPWRRRAVEYALEKGLDSEEVEQSRQLFRHAVQKRG